MTSPKAIALLAVAALGLLTGCDLGHPGGYVARSNSYCAQTSRAIAGLARPVTADQQLRFALDRYTLVEKLVSEMTDSARPGGGTGATLDADWLVPARRSLADGRTDLAGLRAAVRSHTPTAAAFARTLAIGTVGVDTTSLRTLHLSDCALTFTPTTV